MESKSWPMAFCIFGPLPWAIHCQLNARLGSAQRIEFFRAASDRGDASFPPFFFCRPSLHPPTFESTTPLSLHRPHTMLPPLSEFTSGNFFQHSLIRPAAFVSSTFLIFGFFGLDSISSRIGSTCSIHSQWHASLDGTLYTLVYLRWISR